MRRLLLVPVLAMALTGCDGVPVLTVPATVTAPAAAQDTALDLLGTLPVRGRAPMTGYSRSMFLPHGWADLDGNGCDSRRDTLARQAVADVVRKGPHQCVLTATILDPYSGDRIASTKADVDHVTALADSWQTGAQQITPAQREALANDPTNLVATSAHLNRSKADSDAASFLPPLKSYRCEYVARIVAVKARYKLWVTQPEHDAIARVLASRPGQEVPS